ncbi:MAG: exopolysaccharide Pel transporter PelG [Formivibrio sp.]|nr:exopolysaccharide Pel transporter PelG [Formivibrio sp.]
MAGIGFELRKLLKKESYLGLLQAYSYAGIISSGPWILSIVGVLLIGFFSLSVVIPRVAVQQFQVSVTYLLATSLIVTGPLQLAFTRYVADRLFEKKDDMIVPNFLGAQLVTLLIAGGLGTILFFTLFRDMGVFYRLLMLAAFVQLCLIWIATIFLSGMKRYTAIVWVFALGYGTTVAAALLLRPWGLEGLLSGFVFGHYLMLCGLWFLILQHYPIKFFIDFDFLRHHRMFHSLIWTGLFYNLGIWFDKLLFWYAPETSHAIIGPLRASPIYDLPIFLAYLSIIPGMAVFLVRIETDFVEFYERFYRAVREGASLEMIESLRNEMVFTIRQGLAEIVKIQGITILVVFALGKLLLNWLGMSELYQQLLYIDLIAAGLQMVFLAILNIFFYLDKRRLVVLLTGIFVVSNAVLTSVSIAIGPSWYGYGFALSLLLSVCAGMVFLSDKLEKLEYETFMLQ